MEVTATNVRWAVAALLALLATQAILAIAVRGATRRPMIVCITAAFAGVVLLVNAEVWCLSLVPLGRPLRWLPGVHVGLLVVLLVATLRRGGGRVWGATLRRAWCELREYCRDVGLVVSLANLALLLLLLGYFAIGAYQVPGAWDDLEYHVPMAVQPYQDGRLGSVTSDLPWPNAYPRGTELLWYWTLQWSGSDLLFHPVQLAFGIQALLATYVLARRTGASASAATLAAIILGTTPVFFILSTSGYVDLAVAAGVVSVIAFLAPPEDPAAEPTRDWPLAALALAEACLVKLPLLAAVLAGIGFLQAVFRHGPARNGVRRVSQFFRARRGWLAAVLVLIACHTYWRHLLEHRNPFYPMKVSLAGVLFDGPLDGSQFGAGGHTTFGKPVREMSHFERFYYAWMDLMQPPNVDSFGSFGPVLPVLVLAPFLIALLALGWPVDTWRLALGAMFAACLFTPAFLPRYGIPMIAVALAGAAWTVSRLTGAALRGYVIVALLFCGVGVAISARAVWQGYEWTWRQAGGTLPLAARNSFLLERTRVGGEMYCLPTVIQYIRTHSGPADLLVWNVRTFPALLWNRTYSNRVIHLPGAARDTYPGSAALLTVPTAPELARWLQRLGALRPKHVLVYAESAYAQALQAGRIAGYEIAYADPPERLKWRMALFELRECSGAVPEEGTDGPRSAGGEKGPG